MSVLIVPFTLVAADFIRMYADRTYHGKEEDEMLEEYREFDRKLIHEKYTGTVELWETTMK